MWKRERGENEEEREKELSANYQPLPPKSSKNKVSHFVSNHSFLSQSKTFQPGLFRAPPRAGSPQGTGLGQGSSHGFNGACSDSTSGNGFKLKEVRSRLDIRKKCFTVRMVRHWHRVPREVVDAPSLATFKVRFPVKWLNPGAGQPAATLLALPTAPSLCGCCGEERAQL